MTKKDMRALFEASIGKNKLLRAYLHGDGSYWYFIPLRVSERLYLAAVEDDFILDGFTVRRFRDLDRLQVKDDKCVEILVSEGVFGVASPDVDLTDWKSVFLSLQRRGENVIVEGEDDGESFFYIGRVERALSSKVIFRHFDADGIWQDEPYEIAYADISSVTFGSRYVTVFSRYLPPAPKENGKKGGPWKAFLKKNAPEGTSGALRLHFEEGVEAPLRRYFLRFAQWLRETYVFPTTLNVYVLARERVCLRDGSSVYGLFRSFDRRPPLIRIPAAVEAALREDCTDEEIYEMILSSFAHELTHYFQWALDLPQTAEESERQANFYRYRILDRYHKATGTKIVEG